MAFGHLQEFGNPDSVEDEKTWTGFLQGREDKHLRPWKPCCVLRWSGWDRGRDGPKKVIDLVESCFHGSLGTSETSTAVARAGPGNRLVLFSQFSDMHRGRL